MTETNFLKKTMQESTNSMSAQCEKNCCSAHDKLKRRLGAKNAETEREENKMAKGVYYNSATVFVNQRLCQSARDIKNAG